MDIPPWKTFGAKFEKKAHLIRSVHLSDVFWRGRAYCKDARDIVSGADYTPTLTSWPEVSEPINGMLYSDFASYLPDDILVKVDRASMAVSLEVRCPLLDYRVVDTQGLSTFTALQRRGIPSRLLYFPDENHWVLKPHNSIQWHETVLGWLDRWLQDDE